MKLMLVIHSIGGVSYHRLIIPHNNLIKHGFEVYECQNADFLPDENIKDFPIFIFSRFLSHKGENKIVADRIHKAGGKIILDVDDYWRYSKKHLYYNEHLAQEIPAQCEESIRLADYVITTTPILADEIKLLNKNIIICENAIDTTMEQFQPIKTASDKTRFGWFGSSCHLEDIELMKYPFKKLHSAREHYNRYQIILGGWTLQEGISWKYEEIFTDEYKCIREDFNYLNHLKQLKQGPYSKDMCYKRIFATDVYNYAKGYNEVDISLAPLANNLFNSCKSELKAIEAGFMKKALIVSDVMPYKLICNKKNSMLCRTEIDWYVWMRKCIANPNMVEYYAEALYESVKDKYNIETINEKRKQLYESICSPAYA